MCLGIFAVYIYKCNFSSLVFERIWYDLLIKYKKAFTVFTVCINQLYDEVISLNV